MIKRFLIGTNLTRELNSTAARGGGDVGLLNSVQRIRYNIRELSLIRRVYNLIEIIHLGFAYRLITAEPCHALRNEGAA